MDRIEIDYDSLAAECGVLISRAKTWSLATAAGNHVTVRTINAVNMGMKIYFQTDTRLTKYGQIQANPQVALCRENIQIEGLAKDLGHPLTAKNKYFCDLYRRQHPTFFDFYSAVPTQTVVEVSPTLITIWHHDDENAYRKFLLIVAGKAYRENYQTGAG